MGILPMLEVCSRGRLRYIHGLRALATSTSSRLIPPSRALAGASPVSDGLQSVELQCRRFPLSRLQPGFSMNGFIRATHT